MSAHPCLSVWFLTPYERIKHAGNTQANTHLLKISLTAEWVHYQPPVNWMQSLLWLSSTFGCFLTRGDLGSKSHCCFQFARSRWACQASCFPMISVNSFKLIGNNWMRKKQVLRLLMSLTFQGNAFPGFWMTHVVVLANYTFILLNTCFQFPRH